MELEDFAHALGLRIVDGKPSRKRWGSSCNRKRTIRLHPDLGTLQRDYTLAHEVGHAFYEHEGCHPQTEWEADVWAATQLIDRSERDKATAIQDTVEAVATELGVMPKLIHIYHENMRRNYSYRSAASHSHLERES